MVRVTRKEAAARLNVSKSTLDRMVKRGELVTETEQHGLRHTVWVLLDDVVEDTNEDSTGNTNGHFPASSEHIGGDTGAENLALQTEVKGLRELVDLYRERLTDADWRYQEFLEQLKTMTKALPAAQGTGPRAKRCAGGGLFGDPRPLQPRHQTGPKEAGGPDRQFAGE